MLNIDNLPGKSPPRVLVIGAGPTAVDAHLPVLQALSDQGRLELSVICDIDRDRASSAQRRFGFKECTGDSLAALERPDIDAVYVFGSAQLHFECGMIALRNRKHLFVEKPIAPSYAEACQLAHAAQERGLIAVGGLNRRFFKSLALVRERAGRSRWRFAEAVFHKQEYQKQPAFGARTWLSANGIHALDALVHMMGGLPEHVTALAGEAGDAAPSAFSAVMRWSDGAQAVFQSNNNAGLRREEYAFHGLGETYTVGGIGIVIQKDGVTSTVNLPLIGDGFTAEHESFLQAIQEQKDPIHSIGSIAPSLYLAELIETGYSGQVHLPETVAASPPPALIADSILVVPSQELQAGLTRLVPEYRLISVDDVHNSAGPRPDVVAAILGRNCAPLAPEVLDKLPHLRIVGVMALSLGRHQPEALLERGITLINASRAYADSVAEFALGLAILGRRRAFASHSIMRAGGWGVSPSPAGFAGFARGVALRARPLVKKLGLDAALLQLWRGTALSALAQSTRRSMSGDLRGASVGLIGWGQNARAFTSLLLRFGATVSVYSEHATDRAIEDAGARRSSLIQVLGCEIVSLHRGLTPDTRHFLGKAELELLRPGSVLINTARGALIEPSALVARLRKGDVFACLDTYDEEPLPRSDVLRAISNVFLTSHIAGGSPAMHAAAADEVIEKVHAHLKGATVESISAQRLRTMS